MPETVTSTAVLSTFVTRFDYAQIPNEIVQMAKLAILDNLGVAVGAVMEPGVRALMDLVASGEEAPQATVLGTGMRTTLRNAALVNGMLGHMLDYDDTHISTILHGTTPTLMAALPVAEWTGASGRDLIAAYVLGFEIAARVALSICPQHYDRGFHVTGTAGPFGGAVAAGMLLGLSDEQMHHAIGIAAAQAAGLREMFGSDSKPFTVGRATENGATAALLAARGFTAAREPLVGRRGYVRVFADTPDLEVLTDGLGTRWEQLQNGLKPYPCGVVTHPGIDAAVNIHRTYGISPDRIAGATLRAHPYVQELTGKPEPQVGLEGKFSIFHCVAVGLREGAAWPKHFTDAAVNDPGLIDLRRRIRLEVDPALPVEQAVLEVRLTDGTVVSNRVEHARGTPENRFTLQDAVDKFMAVSEHILGADRARAVCDLVLNLENLDNTQRLTELLAVGRPAPEART